MLSDKELEHREYSRSRDDLVQCFPNTYSLATMEVGFGWHGILADLGQELESVISNWQPNLSNLTEESDRLIKPYVARVYVKYGQMYIKLIGDIDENMIRIVKHYERKSLSVCEYCGSPGRLNKRKYSIITTCDKH